MSELQQVFTSARMEERAGNPLKTWIEPQITSLSSIGLYSQLDLKSPLVHDIRVDPFQPIQSMRPQRPGESTAAMTAEKPGVQAAAGMDPNEPVYVILPDPSPSGGLVSPAHKYRVSL